MPRGVSRYDEADLQRRLATPLQYRPWGWWTSRHLSSLTASSTGISEIRDLSGNGRTMMQTTTTIQPQLVDGVLPVSASQAMRFGSSRLLTRAGNPPGGAATIFATCRATSNMSFGGLWTGGEYGLFCGFGSDAIFAVDGSGLTAGDTANTASLVNQWGVVTVEYTQSSTAGSSIWWRGTLSETQGAVGRPVDVGWGRTELGGRTYGNQAGRVFQGEILEVLVFFPRLSSFERQFVEGYMAWSAGLPLDASHPFANRPPLIGD